MGKYYNSHLMKTSDPTPLTITKLERGMVVKIKYLKENKVKQYLVFVLQPKWPNNSDGKLHGLSLDELLPSKFKDFAKNYNEVFATSKRVRRLDIAKIRIDEASKVFYTSEIKTDKSLRVGYRTFSLKNIKGISAVNYDWGKYDKIPSASERRELLEQQRLEDKARNQTMDDRE